MSWWTKHWWVGWLLVQIVGAGCSKKAGQSLLIEAPPGISEAKGILGKGGGTLRFPDSGASLQIPADLLQENISLSFRREKPFFDLPGKGFVGPAYRIAPKISFAPGSARLLVPLENPLPGPPNKLGVKLYYFERMETDGPQGPGITQTWQPFPLAKFKGLSRDQKYLQFDLAETVSDFSTHAPFGLLQVGFDVPKG